MRILFDQARPVPLRPFLLGYVIRTAAQEGWDRLSNGRLLSAAEDSGFDLLLTPDKNMCYQQIVAGRKIAAILLTRQQWPQLRQHVSLVVDAVNAAVVGSYLESYIP